MRENKTISQVVKDSLCIGCGTCIALCPEEAIKLTIDEKKGIYIPELDGKKCNHCGICYKVCPGHEVDFKELNLKIFEKESENVLIGNYLNCYVGHSTEYDIRYTSASGGLVTQLLIFALEEGIIDGALVTRMKKDNPLEPEPFVARNREEIIEASKSKYCPVPANIALKEILNSKEGEKFAVVGLPCHIHGIRKAEMINKKLKEKIILHLGILCSINRNFLSQDYLFKKFNVDKEDVVKFDYRGEGWIGGMTITLKNGDKIHSPHPIYYTQILRSYFIPVRCTLCSDQSCELADASFGDIWIPEFMDDRIGTSVIIVRNMISENILQNMISNMKIELNNLNKNKLILSQIYPLHLKKTHLNARITLFKLFGKATPIYNQELLKPTIFSYLHAVLFYSYIFLSSKRYLWNFLDMFATPLRFKNYLNDKIKIKIKK
jgi:coenzyme F420 hydrogenase subunit beta